MNMLIPTLQSLGNDPWAWGAVGVLTLLAAISLWRYRSCERLCDEPRGDRQAAAEYLNRRVAAGPRFFLLMVGGIAAMVAGLGMIAGGLSPAFGFALLVIGVVVVQTEPLRQRIRTASARVVAAGDNVDRQAAARAGLRDSHRGLVLMNVLLAAGVALGLLAF